MTQFIEVSSTKRAKSRLINLTDIASIEDRNKTIIIHLLNESKTAIELSMSYESFKEALEEGKTIIYGGQEI